MLRLAITIQKPAQSSQALRVQAVEIPGGDQAVFAMSSPRAGVVSWYNGGVAWTIKELVDGESVEVVVEHSLLPTGDAHAVWVEDPDSPFTDPAQGHETTRVARIRFRNIGTDTVLVVLASNAQFTVA